MLLDLSLEVFTVVGEHDMYRDTSLEKIGRTRSFIMSAAAMAIFYV
jgi:hypothetical protein